MVEDGIELVAISRSKFELVDITGNRKQGHIKA